jgi:hypothetical protein
MTPASPVLPSSSESPIHPVGGDPNVGTRASFRNSSQRNGGNMPLASRKEVRASLASGYWRKYPPPSPAPGTPNGFVSSRVGPGGRLGAEGRPGPHHGRRQPRLRGGPPRAARSCWSTPTPMGVRSRTPTSKNSISEGLTRDSCVPIVTCRACREPAVPMPCGPSMVPGTLRPVGSRTPAALSPPLPGDAAAEARPMSGQLRPFRRSVGISTCVTSTPGGF